ncbi:MAG: hypothetical protein AAF560_29820 [Acidobacteriota bacterium]
MRFDLHSGSAGIWRAVALTLVLTRWILAPAVLAQAAPRAISEIERQGVALAMVYLEQGPTGWWDRLATEAPLRALGREAALQEIGVRAGPAEGSHWALLALAPRYGENTVALGILFPSGLEEVLFLELVDEGGWKIKDLRCLADPTSLRSALPTFFWDSGAPPPPGQTPSGGAPPSAVVLWLTGLLAVTALLLALCPSRLVPTHQLLFGRVAVCLLALTVVAACQEQGEQETTEEAVFEVLPIEQLGPLLPLREALAGVTDEDHKELFRALPKTGPVAEVGRLWEAQYLLPQSQLNPVQKILETFPEDSKLPLVGWLRARLAFLRSEHARAAELYDHMLHRQIDFDGLRQEAAGATAPQADFKDVESDLMRIANLGTRHASNYYFLAQFAVADDRMEEAEKHFRTAWQLEPLHREELFDDSVLAILAARPSLYESLELGSTDEPVVTPSGERRPLDTPETAEPLLLGDNLTITLGGAKLEIPGGAVLAPESTPVEDAATRAKRHENEALASVENLRGLSIGALAQPKLRRDTMLAATALAKQRRWDELLELTAGAGDLIDQLPPELTKLKAQALIENNRVDEARSLLVKMAQSDINNRRRDPLTFYQLGELLAKIGDFDRAIRAHQKAASLNNGKRGSLRARQLEMERDLANSYKEYKTKHFDIRYPVSTNEKYPQQLGEVLEAERKRISAWIPARSRDRVEVHLFPLNEFMQAFSTNVTVLGLYDGRVRVPFADLESLDPAIISILSHELAHAMIADYTQDRAPKWLHEGLAQHVQMVQDFVNPIPDLHRASRILAFPVIEMVLSGLAEPQLVELAYSEASWIVHFIEARYGKAGLRRLMDAFARGLDTEQAIRRAFKLSMKSFEKKAWAWCLNEAPAAWPTELYRYDRDFNPYLERRQPQAAKKQPLVRPTSRRTQRANLREAMVAWHPKYAARSRPVKVELGQAMKAFRQSVQPPGDIVATCSRLQTSLTQMLQDGQAMAAPDPNVAKYLEEAYNGFHRMAIACRSGQDAAVRNELNKAERALGIAAKTLSKYGLKP